ncbi:long-chain-fatty-acid--CoA ligase [Klugiella xanthotipulae]|uniref:Long-chain acyl-CoA synthetase n=1 Tax=Klugiella xanthotipulae TaxID=244735 RepID=A0A543HRY8_9MICO|nr:long-chain-fatty-acid--CoA ligase [Klugiella xanthotipulae]TQM61107.1 long-chain acyl-CoA synthetase [Klugiella xanthotipulae]
MSTLADRPWTAHYAPGVPADLTLPTISLVDVIHASVNDYADTIALDFFGATTTYRELGEQIERVATGLHTLGVRHGDRVALVLPNCPQHVVAFYAALRLGAIVVEHNPLYTPRELRTQFEDHGAQVVIAWENVCGTLQALPADVRPTTIIAVNLIEAMPLSKRLLLKLPIAKARESRQKLGTTTTGTIPWRRLATSDRIADSIRRPGHNDLALLQYTSGTTGTPKGAMLSHRNLLANALQAQSWVPAVTKGDCCVYGVLPMFHAYGMTLCLTFAMSMGARLVLFPSFDVDLVLAAAQKHLPTFLPAVPPMYDRIAETAHTKRVALGGITCAISGAMDLPPSTVERWEEATGGWLVEGYGLTEAAPVALCNPVGSSRKAGTVGVPLPGCEIKLVAVENPEDSAPDGGPGELLFRGPQVFSGYWKNAEATAEALTPDGWLRTGDIVTADRDGFVTIVDRKKELIVTGGFNVSPTEVESVLRSYDGVEDAAAIGIPRSNGGESVVAVVVMRPGYTFDEESVREHCRTGLTPYKVPRSIEVWDELPRSLIGKILRKEIKEKILAR